MHLSRINIPFNVHIFRPKWCLIYSGTSASPRALSHRESSSGICLLLGLLNVICQVSSLGQDCRVTRVVAECAVGLLQFKAIACVGKGVQWAVWEWHMVLNLSFSFMGLRSKVLCRIPRLEKWNTATCNLRKLLVLIFNRGYRTCANWSVGFYNHLYVNLDYW